MVPMVMRRSIPPHRLAAFVTLFCLAASACSSARRDNALKIHAPQGVSVTVDRSTARGYPQTRCFDFQQKGRSVGFLCSSSSTRFVTDFGITATTGSLDGQEHFQVATGMSTYEMKPATIDGRMLFTAEVDCDEGDGPLSRATSTCHVAFMPRAGAHVLYSNFVLRNNATSASGVDARTVMGIWEDLSNALGGP